MTSFFRQSLVRRVALIVGAASLVVTGLGLAGMLLLFRADTREHARRTVETIGESLATAFATFDRQVKRHPIAELTAELEQLFDLEQVEVFNRRGEVIWSQNESRVGRSISPGMLAAYHAGHRVFAESDAGRNLSLLRPVRARQSCLECHRRRDGVERGALLGGLFLQISHQALTSKLSAYGQLQIITALLLVAFVVVVTALAMRMFVTAPLRKLDQAIQAAEAGNFLHRINGTGPDEVGRLAEDFNRLLARLTEVQASKIDSDVELGLAQQELELKNELEEKNLIIEETNRKLTRRLNELGLLFETTRALSTTLEIDRVLQTINELIGVTLQYQRFGILLLDERHERLVLKSVYGAKPDQVRPGMAVDANEGLIGQAVRSGRRVLVRDLSTLVERQGPVEEVLPPRGSFLCLPMRHQDRLLGALVFVRPQPDGFPDEEIRLLTSLGRQAAMAILNAQLYQEKLELSVTDDLTKLANRRQMQARLDLEWNRANRFASDLSVLMIDIDFFKRYNDVNGHLLGDQVLVGVAQALQENTRKVDTVARFGGEEFVVILPGQDKKSAAAVAEKLRRAVARREFPRVASQPRGHLSITAGVASFPGDASDPGQLVDRADLALYVAKRAGRDRVAVWEEGMETTGARRSRDKARRPRKRRRRRRPSGASRRNRSLTGGDTPAVDS